MRFMLFSLRFHALDKRGLRQSRPKMNKMCAAIHCHKMQQRVTPRTRRRPDAGPDQKNTTYCRMALRNNPEVESMQRTVMAAFYHVMFTDEEPHHKLCPPGPPSWCRHQAADSGKLQPLHKYKLSGHVATALLAVYQCLSGE